LRSRKLRARGADLRTLIDDAAKGRLAFDLGKWLIEGAGERAVCDLHLADQGCQFLTYGKRAVLRCVQFELHAARLDFGFEEVWAIGGADVEQLRRHTDGFGNERSKPLVHLDTALCCQHLIERAANRAQNTEALQLQVCLGAFGRAIEYRTVQTQLSAQDDRLIDEETVLASFVLLAEFDLFRREPCDRIRPGACLPRATSRGINLRLGGTDGGIALERDALQIRKGDCRCGSRDLRWRGSRLCRDRLRRHDQNKDGSDHMAPALEVCSALSC
jgi:hypothetical protein